MEEYNIDTVFCTEDFIDKYGSITDSYINKFLEKNKKFTLRMLCQQVIKSFIIVQNIGMHDIKKDISIYIRISIWLGIAFEFLGLLNLPFATQDDRDFVFHRVGINFTTKGNSFRSIMIELLHLQSDNTSINIYDDEYDNNSQTNDLLYDLKKIL